MNFTSQIFIDDIPFDIECNFFAGEPQTWDEPGYPDDVEFSKMWFGGVLFTDDQANLFIESYGEKDFYEWMLEEAYNNIQSEQEAYADHLYEQWKDDKKGLK